MGVVILLDRELDVLRKVRQDAIKWLPAEHHRLFKTGYDTWIARHSEEAKRQLAREFMKLTLPMAKRTVYELLNIFREWEAVKKGAENGKMGMPSEHSGEHGECDPALPSVGTSGSEPSDGDGSAASPLPVRGETDLPAMPD